MKAVTWQGKREISVEQVPDPQIKESDDIIIELTSSGLCGSDLHLYETLGPFLHPGDVLGHEPMGRVVEKGAAIKNLQVGDRVVIPFQIACGHCFMCVRGLQTQCEVTQVRIRGRAPPYLATRIFMGQFQVLKQNFCVCLKAITGR